ncbi:MAG: pyruvate dehydrogenase (acetyl-transferring) E1 component subunit alpha [Armatimonadota bacterium]|nr:pyruvate dehydrogenase (acetyl-transferring) E1 component subunit alpha [Armatimonadota bacterium]MDR7611742.1 pyruvate dehydrogenase (acetyl-transferring) E1 component subunit alpha [Armatimonadota bacterium]
MDSPGQAAAAVALPTPPMVQMLDSDGRLLVDRPPLSDDEILRALRAMLLSRRFDERCIALQRRGLMVTLAPGIGQEACSVGSAMALDPSRDWFVPQYREAAGMLWHGLPLVQAFLWHMGSPLGFAVPTGKRFLPFQAAVAGHLPHATGLAWGLRLRGSDAVVLAHFGEGATSQGDFHEALNIAGVVKAPVVFFCQNNYWAISTPVEWQTAASTVAQKAVAYGFPGVRVDGNDLFAVYEVTRQAVARARAGEGPTLIEGVTYRLGLHTTADDASRYEPSELREQWRDRDPLLRLQRYLRRQGVWSDALASRLEDDVRQELDAAWEEARRYPPPRLADSLERVFAEMTPRLRAQHAAAREDE